MRVNRVPPAAAADALAPDNEKKVNAVAATSHSRIDFATSEERESARERTHLRMSISYHTRTHRLERASVFFSFPHSAARVGGDEPADAFFGTSAESRGLNLI